MRLSPAPLCSRLIHTLGCGVDTSEVPFEGGYISFTEPPLPPFFEGGQDNAARRLVNGIGTYVEQKGDLARIQENVVLIGHHRPTRRYIRERVFVVRCLWHRQVIVPDRLTRHHNQPQ